jgi:23S rRNA pseudouridine1911/1915/1917 synthase
VEIHYELCTPERIDKYLQSLGLDEFYSRMQIQRLLDEKRILVNGKSIKKSYILNLNDTIEITFPEPRSTELEAENIPLDIVYEDEFLAVINKPAGLVVHPGHGNESHTLVNGLIYHFREHLSAGSHPARPGIVHRLDVGTSGLIIIAKDDSTHVKLSHMFQEHLVQKHYLAIVVGTPEPFKGTIESFLHRSLKNPLKMEVGLSGRWSVTGYEVSKMYQHFSVMNVFPSTGRMHQIRVHFTWKKHPILGDPLYGGTDSLLSYLPHEMHRKVKALYSHLGRQALHAYRLEFRHPQTGKDMLLEAPVPADIAYCLDWLSGNDNLC